MLLCSQNTVRRFKPTLVNLCLLGAVSFLFGCIKSLPTVAASSSKQLTQELVLQARFSKNSSQAFVLTQGPVFSRWDTATGKLIQSIGSDELSRSTRTFVISNNEKSFVTSDGKSLTLWDLESSFILGTIDFRQQLGDASINSIAIIGDSILVAGNSDGTIIFADVANNLYRQRHTHSNEVVMLLVGHENKFLYSAGNDGKVIVTDLKNFTTHSEYTTPFRITGLSQNSDNSLIFIADALDQQVVWQPWQNRVISELDYWQQYRFFRLGLFADDDALLMTTSPKTEISLWNISSGKEIASWTATAHSMGTSIMDIQELSDGQVITITSDAVIQIWDISPFYL